MSLHTSSLTNKKVFVTFNLTKNSEVFAFAAALGDYHHPSPPILRRVPPAWAVAALAAAAAAGAVLGLASCLLLRPECRERRDVAAPPTAPTPVSSATPTTPVSFVCFCVVVLVYATGFPKKGGYSLSKHVFSQT